MKPIEFDFRNHHFTFSHTAQAQQIINEIFSDNYHVLESVENGKLIIKPRDVILDIGANEGMWSIMMAKLFPETRIYAFEPVGMTYITMAGNIGMNKVENITAFNLAVGDRIGNKSILANTELTGGSSFWETVPDKKDTEFWKTHAVENVVMTTLDRIFWSHKEQWIRVKLLKFDVEGGEYDMFYGTSVLNQVDCVIGEIHINDRLTKMGRKIQDLITYLSWQTRVIWIETCKMAE